MGEQARRGRARLTAEDGAGVLVVSLEGELDIGGVADIQPALDRVLRCPARPLELDLSGLAFLDSSGVAVLIRLANQFGGARISAVTSPVRRVLEVLGLSRRFGLDGS